MAVPFQQNSDEPTLPKAGPAPLFYRMLFASVAPLIISMCGLSAALPGFLFLLNSVTSYYFATSVAVSAECEGVRSYLALLSSGLLLSFIAGIILIFVTSAGVIAGKTAGWFFHICIWLLLFILTILFVQNIVGFIFAVIICWSPVIIFFTPTWRAFYRIPPIKSSRFVISLLSHALIVLIIPFIFRELSSLIPHARNACIP